MVDPRSLVALVEVSNKMALAPLELAADQCMLVAQAAGAAKAVKDMLGIKDLTQLSDSDIAFCVKFAKAVSSGFAAQQPAPAAQNGTTP